MLNLRFGQADTKETGINVVIAEDIVSSVALGTGQALDSIEEIEFSYASEARIRR